MLTRLYINNFKCFVDFEYRPGQRQLVLGGNGSGKSSLMEALQRLRLFLTGVEKVEMVFSASDRTRWLHMLPQQFELEAELGGCSYLYDLHLSPIEEPLKPVVTAETLRCDGKPIFSFATGQVQLYNDDSVKLATYPFDSSRSALATITPTKDNDNTKLIRFKRWVENILYFRINPFFMTPRAALEDSSPAADLSNFAAWYRYLEIQNPDKDEELFKSLRSSIDGFDGLLFENAGKNLRLLLSRFSHEDRSMGVYFDELSDGQRILICLYTILHFVIARGGTVAFDEPDNFISLRELQPWLLAVDDAIEDHGGQVLIISHHPELINQWAPSYGVRFVRDGVGPVRAEKFTGDPDSPLLPAELIARGWDRG